MTQTVAEFDSPKKCRRAIERLQDLGFKQLEVYMPYPEKSLLDALELNRSPLPRFVLAAGFCGALFSYWVLWITNVVDYPLNVGGRPLHPVPAFIPIAFEMVVLLAGTTAFAAGLFLCGLPRFHHPVFELDGFERVSVDGWFLAVDHDSDPSACERCRSLLVEGQARRVQVLPSTHEPSERVTKRQEGDEP